MKGRQLFSAWIFAILWALTIFLWYAGSEYGFGFTQFIQATIFWGVFAWITHMTLASTNTNDPLASIEKLIIKGKFLEALELIMPQELSVVDPEIKSRLKEHRVTCALGISTELHGKAVHLFSQNQYEQADNLFGKLESLLIENLEFFEVTSEDKNSFLKEFTDELEKCGSQMKVGEIPQLRNRMKANIEKRFSGVEETVFQMLLDCYVSKAVTPIVLRKT